MEFFTVKVKYVSVRLNAQGLIPYVYSHSSDDHGTFFITLLACEMLVSLEGIVCICSNQTACVLY